MFKIQGSVASHGQKDTTLNNKDSDKNISSQRQRGGSKNSNSSPGPGAYRIKSMFENKSGFSIPSAKIFPKDFKKPDPWSYLPNDFSIKTKSPNAIFGKQSRREKQKEGPSPAHYKANYNIVFHTVRSPLFRAERLLRLEQQAQPGPGNYDITKFDSINSNHRSAKIGTEKRSFEEKQKRTIPAPNLYQTESEFDTAVRKRRGFSIGQRLKCRTQSDLPANYLKYNTNKEIIMRKGPAFTFQRSVRKENHEISTPGPAQYSLKICREKGVTIGKSQRKLHDIPANPGPEAYSSPPKQEGPSFSIPKSKKTIEETLKNPGPGKYSPQLPESQKYKAISIGVGDRSNFIANGNVPGPGLYNLTMRHTTGGFSYKKFQNRMGRDDKNRANDRKPGVGPADNSKGVSEHKGHV